MKIPDWYVLILLSLAAWRTWFLLGQDDILDRPRNWLVGLKPGATSRTGGREKLMEFLECPFCLGFWVALAWWIAWQIWPHGTEVAAAAVAIFALVPLIERASSSD